MRNELKRRFYDEYFSTHVLHRKGKATLEEYRLRSIYYQRTWCRFFPEDKNAKIIDAGCGNGALVWWLQQIGFVNAEGIDISPEQVELAGLLGARNVTQSDLKVYLKRKPFHYDVIIFRDIIEHFEKQEIVETLEICYDSLRRNGTVIIQVPNAESPFFGRIRYGDFTHEIAFSTSSLSQLLNVIGFTDVKFYSTEPIVTGARSLFRFTLWKIVEALYKFLLYVELGRGPRIVTQGIIAVATKAN